MREKGRKGGIIVGPGNSRKAELHSCLQQDLGASLRDMEWGQWRGNASFMPDIEDLLDGCVSMAFYLFPEDGRNDEVLNLMRFCSSLEEYEVYWLAPEKPASGILSWIEETRVRKYGFDFYLFSYVRLTRWQASLKRFFDIGASLAGLLLTAPLLLLCALLVKLGSPGGVFYTQVRIGLGGKPFRLYKFRSMKENAETSGPELSNEEDRRVTSWGRIMRRYRIDELPQLWNVLGGDMSLIGYRPERKYFIDKITRVAPFYVLLYAVKPGISSQGMVDFGYAESVEEMIVRLGADMDYLRDLSLGRDLKVIAKTLSVVVRGLGR